MLRAASTSSRCVSTAAVVRASVICALGCAVSQTGARARAHRTTNGAPNAFANPSTRTSVFFFFVFCVLVVVVEETCRATGTRVQSAVPTSAATTAVHANTVRVRSSRVEPRGGREDAEAEVAG